MTFRITYSVLDADMTELNKQFEAALSAVKSELGRKWPSHVVGLAADKGEYFVTRAPADTRVELAWFQRVDAATIDTAVRTAKKAQQAWWALGWQERVARVKKAAELISERRLRFAAFMSMEVGKNRLESLGDVEESADLLRYYAGQVESADGFSRPLGKLAPNESTRDTLKPYGVFAVIAPFNFPMALSAGMAGAALLAGNAAILKPSENAPMSAQFLFEVFRDAGLPEGLFQVIHGEGSTVGKALSTHPGIDGIAFTGGTSVGRELHAAMTSGRFHRPCLMELGGKNGALVMESADLDAAVEGVARSSFGLSGQKCSALSRVFVHQKRHAEFVERLVARTRSIVVGDPTRAEVFMGPVINAQSAARFEASAARAKADGTIHTGGKRPSGEAFAHGHFVEPTIVTVPRGHALTLNELFLPFITLDTVRDIDDALERLNEVDMGLTAGIFSKDEAELAAYEARAQAGVLYANRKTGATTGAWPGVQSFCGWKASGSSGKGGCGPYYVAQFAREQSWTRMM